MLNLEALSTFWRGRSGERAMPPLDGPLRQNDELEAAWPALEKLDDPQDLVFD